MTFLKTSRCPEFMHKEGRDKAIKNLKKNGIEYVTIRGNYQKRYEDSKKKILELMRGA